MDKISVSKATQKLKTEEFIKQKRDIHDKRVTRLYTFKKSLKSYNYIYKEML